jgi:large subunit ribosomal protein L6
MSRIGKAPIKLPAGVDFKISNSNLVTVKGPKGELHQQVDADITITLNEGEILVSRPTDHKRHRALHGLYRSLINNMIVGVTQGYTKKTRISRCWLQSNKRRKYS